MREDRDYVDEIETLSVERQRLQAILRERNFADVLSAPSDRVPIVVRTMNIGPLAEGRRQMPNDPPRAAAPFENTQELAFR